MFLNVTGIALCIIFQSAAVVCAKYAGSISLGRGVAAIIINPWYAGQLAALSMQTICWILILRRLPLSFVYPFMSLVFPLNLVLALLFFQEKVQFNHIVGTILIVCGVVIIAMKVPE
jgi:drug/metabolite transporter (DMT)-like permease